MHAASKYGHAFSPQSTPSGRMSARSPLAPTIGALAQWHLNRLAPAGKDIPYNPAGTAEERDQAFKAWKKLIPDGQLPPKPKPKDK